MSQCMETGDVHFDVLEQALRVAEETEHNGPTSWFEAVEATNFSSLSFVAEPLDEVLVDDTVRCCKKARTWEMK